MPEAKLQGFHTICIISLTSFVPLSFVARDIAAVVVVSCRSKKKRGDDAKYLPPPRNICSYRCGCPDFNNYFGFFASLSIPLDAHGGWGDDSRELSPARRLGDVRHRFEDQQGTVKSILPSTFLGCNGLTVSWLRRVTPATRKSAMAASVVSNRKRSAHYTPGRGYSAFATRCAAFLDAPGSRRYTGGKAGFCVCLPVVHAERIAG